MVSFEIKNASGTILIYEINLTTSTITVDPHRLEVKGTYQLTLEIQQILESHDLKGYIRFCSNF